MNIENSEELIKKIDKRIAELEAKEKGKDNPKEESLENETTAKVMEMIETIKAENLEISLQKLNNLIGLTEVKEEVNKLTNYLKFCKRIKGKSSLDRLNLNMIFKGSPGTGKTTVARIIAGILYNLGYLESKAFIETTPRDFIGEYIGHTSIKSKKLIDKYKGGVIFVDEAYGFVHEEGEYNFADEAIVEIIKEMETKETVFIFSGYPKDMNRFIELNSGIKSRVGYHIDFKDYTEEELSEIFKFKLTKSNFQITEDAYENIKNIIKIKKQEKNFGNGRMIDNLYDEVLLEHASLNYDNENESELLIMKNESVGVVMTRAQQKQRRGYFE